MTVWEDLERELRRRGPGWWERVSAALPEVRALAGVPQPAEYHGEGDVAVHTRLAVEACPADCDPDLLWAALLHDVGKPAVTETVEGRVRAHGHAAAGAELAARMLGDLGMPAPRCERIAWAVRMHVFHHGWNLTDPSQASRHHRRVAADPRFPLLLELLRVDSLASHGNPRGLGSYHLYRQLREEVCRAQGCPEAG